MKKKLYQDEQWLREQYWENELTIIQMAKLADCGKTTIWRWMKKHCIPTRYRVDAEGIYANADWLHEQYWEEELSVGQMAKLANCSQGAILKWMKKYNVPIRHKLGKDAIYADRDWLYEHYWKKELDMKQMAKLGNCDLATIRQWMIKHDILRRQPSEVLDLRTRHRNEPYMGIDWLREQYIEKGLSAIAIADICNVCSTTIHYWMKKYNITKHTRSKSVKLSKRSRRGRQSKSNQKSTQCKDKPYMDKDWLHKQYCVEKLSMQQIAEKCGVTINPIVEWMKRHGIERRSLSEAHTIEKRLYMDKKWLSEQYWDKGLYLRDLAEECNASVTTILKWMERYNIPRRSNSEARKKAWAEGLIGDDEWHRNQSLATQKAWADGVYDNRDMPSIVKKAWAEGKYDGVFQSPTSIEIAISEALAACSLDHISQYRPDNCSYIYDEFVPPNILIEAHGDYWHGPKRPKQQKRDIKKIKWATKNDYVLVVFWEHEIEELGAWPLIKNRIFPLLPEFHENSFYS